MLLIQDVPMECINHAATTYQVPAALIVSILKTEGGSSGKASRNSNGSVDYGPMQVNSCHLKRLAQYGITKDDLQYKPCVNVVVGAWLLAKSIASGKSIWHGVGIYHSRTDHFNEKYRDRVKRSYNWITDMIKPKEQRPPDIVNQIKKSQKK